MSAPYFQVGEEVIVISKRMPEFNGDHTIDKVFEKGVHRLFIGGEFILLEVMGACGYVLSDIGLHEHKGSVTIFAQSTLRKKHKPSDESFSELITNYTFITKNAATS